MAERDTERRDDAPDKENNQSWAHDEARAWIRRIGRFFVILLAVIAVLWFLQNVAEPSGLPELGLG
jgi:hypothetical protein